MGYITHNTNKCDITNMFLSTVISKLFSEQNQLCSKVCISKAFLRHYM